MSKIELLVEETFRNSNVREYPELIGKTFTDVKQRGDELIFDGDDSYKFYHEQDCCEGVWLEDICGDLSDLIGEPIVTAEEVSTDGGEVQPKSQQHEYRYDESCTWTFYKFSTIKGSVTVRWFGTSNGYYSESVDFEKL